MRGFGNNRSGQPRAAKGITPEQTIEIAPQLPRAANHSILMTMRPLITKEAQRNTDTDTDTDTGTDTDTDTDTGTDTDTDTDTDKQDQDELTIARGI